MEEIIKTIQSSRILTLIQSRVEEVLSSDFSSAAKAVLADPKAASAVWAKWPTGDLALIIHALATAVFVKKLVQGKQHSWLLHAVIFMFICFAGKTIESLMLALPLGWVMADRAVAIAFVCWWIVNCSPVDIAGKFFCFGPVHLLLDVADSAIRANALVRTFQLVLQTYPDSIFAFFFVGIAIGSGRALLADAYRFAMGSPSQSQLSAPSWPIKSAFYVTLGYFIMVDPFKLLFPPDALKPEMNHVVTALKLFLVSAQLMQPFLHGVSVPPLNIFEAVFTTAFGLRSAEWRSRQTPASAAPGPKSVQRPNRDILLDHKIGQPTERKKKQK